VKASCWRCCRDGAPFGTVVHAGGAGGDDSACGSSLRASALRGRGACVGGRPERAGAHPDSLSAGRLGRLPGPPGSDSGRARPPTLAGHRQARAPLRVRARVQRWACPEALHSELSRAYRRASLSVHPDKNPSPDARRAFDALSEAQKTLQDAGKRGEYVRGQGERLLRELTSADPARLASPALPPSASATAHFRPRAGGCASAAQGAGGGRDGHIRLAGCRASGAPGRESKAAQATGGGAGGGRGRWRRKQQQRRGGRGAAAWMAAARALRRGERVRRARQAWARTLLQFLNKL